MKVKEFLMLMRFCMVARSLRIGQQELMGIAKDSKGNTNRCYEAWIGVVIDDLVFKMHILAMNGAKSMKDNSMNQLQVWNSMRRAS